VPHKALEAVVVFKGMLFDKLGPEWRKLGIERVLALEHRGTCREEVRKMIKGRSSIAREGRRGEDRGRSREGGSS